MKCGEGITISINQRKRRDRLCIIADIIEITKEGTLKTQIMYKANLSFTQLNDYLALMLNHNLITQSIYDGREGYVVTGQGLDFLQKHAELIRLLKPAGHKKNSVSSQSSKKA
jgi:predicted transcriptional regulator